MSRYRGNRIALGVRLSWLAKRLPERPGALHHVRRCTMLYRVHPIPWLVLVMAGRAFAQSAPASPDRVWHSSVEQQMKSDAKSFGESKFSIEPDRVYSLSELVDLAQTHNPETRVAWEK